MMIVAIIASLLSWIAPPSAAHIAQLDAVRIPYLPVVVATTAAPPFPQPVIARKVASWERAEWTKVAQCETGQNWSAHFGAHNGGLGIARVNWIRYGGLEFALTAGTATETAQIMVAERIQYPHIIPDQHECTKGGW